MATRSQEDFRENLRKAIESNMFTNARLMDGQSLARTVDSEALNNCMLSMYCQQDGLNRRMIERSGDYDEMEKARDTVIDSNKTANHADYRQIGLDQSIQKIYFDHFGHGSNDSPVVDRPDAPYKCECGTTYRMSWRTLPLECRCCHRITPMGELVRDGVFKR